ncbi:MAG: hypothetical protein IT355_19400 [Gemmatimonadaceae bacterium]|nr:hypothetical protein [Gemmatimonadaceae bacterium]
MSWPGRLPARYASAAISAALAFASVLPAQRPARADTLSTRVRDSILAAVLADTLDLDLEPSVLLPPVPAFRQTLTLRPTLRRYTVGVVHAAEEASSVNWVGRFRRGTVRLDVTPVAYTGDTSTTASRPAVSFAGATPVSLRLDVPLRAADTVRVFAQTTSLPGALDPVDALALGAVGTSTLDLDAGALGVTARIGARYVLSREIGGGALLSLRGGLEYEPKPAGREMVSWRGTTLRGGVAVSRESDLTTLGASVELTRSIADSLGGRNLFPGGGALTIDARVQRFIGEAGDGFVSLNGFHSRPVDMQRPDVATRIIPIGDFTGVTLAAAIPRGRLSVLPSLSYLRESSRAQAIVSGRDTRLVASGQSTAASLGLSVPLGRLLTITPEAGVVIGDVGQTVTAQFPRRVRTLSFSDAIRGGWASVELSFSR